MTPSNLVLKRLEHILGAHETSLAGLTLRRNNCTQAKTDDDGCASPIIPLPGRRNKTKTNQRITASIVEAALRRSYCPQPPLDSSHLGGSWNVVADLNLNPAERVAPQKLVLPSSSHQHHEDGFEYCDHDNNEITNTHVSSNADLIHNGASLLSSSILSRDDIESIIASSTFKVITVISTICDEVHELDTVANAKFIPQLTLFAHDLKILSVNSSRSQSSSSTATLAAVAATAMDDKAMAKRDSELLRRIGSFISTLQTIMNFSLRCQRLLRNLIAQLDGCFRPISSWGSCSTPATATASGDGGGNGDNYNNTSAWTVDENSQGGQMYTTSGDPSLFSRDHKQSHNRNHNQSRKTETTCIPLLPIGDAIAKILGILISIDYVIAHNMELQEAWDLYKSVVRDKSDQLQKLEIQVKQQLQTQLQQGTDHTCISSTEMPDSDGCTDVDDDRAPDKMRKKHDETSFKFEEQRNKLMLLERMMLQIDFTLLSSRSYIIAIEQNFDPHGQFFNSIYYSNDSSSKYNDVGDNNTNTSLPSVGPAAGLGGGSEVSFTLHEEIKKFIMTMFRKCFSLIHTKHETTERTDLIGIYGMYGLYRRLLPSHYSPDETMHKSLSVDLPLICPIIPLIGTTDVPFIPLQFLSRYAPLARVGGNNSVGGGNNFNLSVTMEEARELMKKNDAVFTNSVEKLHADATLWLLAAESDLAPSTLSSIPSRQKQNGEGEIRATDDDGNDNLSSLPLGETNDDNDTLLLHTNMGGGGQRQQTSTSIVEFKAVVILRGVRIARCSIIMLKHYLHMHKSVDAPIRSEHIASIEKLCFIIKSIEKTLRGRRRSSVVSFQQAALKMVASSIFKRFDTLRSYIDQHSASINHVHTLSQKIKLARLGSCLSTLETLLKGSATFSPARRYAIEVAICACADGGDDKDFNAKVMDVSDNLIHNLRLITDLDDNMKEAFDCSFLYFYKGVLPTLLKHIYKSGMKLESPGLQLILSAFSDPCQLLSSKYTEPQNELKPPLQLEQYSSFVIDESLQSALLIPICECIENNLRLHVYAKNIKELKPPNPRKEQNKNNVLWFLEMPLLHVCGISIDIKGYVQRHLESSFYNFSTVGLQDSQSYVEMSDLARDMYDLDLVDNCLPAGLINQGTDLVTIAKDMKSFTSTYNYDINQQTFIERRPQDGCKHLNTLGIESVSFSLKRHGMGIAASTSHMSYQFISKTFQSFSKLLVNDYFRSTLSKERRWFEQQESAQLVPYPIERAISLSKDIGNLGTTDEGISVLEYCKNLVTSLGNALGLVRLMTTGKLHAKNKVMQYLTPIQRCCFKYDGNNIATNIVDKAPECIHDEKVKISGNKNYIERLKLILNAKSPEEKDLLQTVLKVFKEVISDSDHSHLDCVFLLFPALCLCWLESSLKGKSMVNKTFRTDDAFYTDDGFAMGAAFLLSILEQHDKLDGLAWFETFRAKYIMERNDIRLRITEEEGTLKSIESTKQKSIPFLSFEQSLKPAEESKGTINNELTRLKVIAKRLELRMHEMEMLYYSVQGACIFFRKR